MNDEDFLVEFPEWKGPRETLELIIEGYETALEADPHTATDGSLDKTQLNFSKIRRELLKPAESAEKLAQKIRSQIALIVEIDGTAFDPVCGQTIPPEEFDLIDTLNNFAKIQRKRADEIKSGGGKNNLWKKFHGPPEWRMARDIADYFIAEKMGTKDDFIAEDMGTKDDFLNLCANIQEYITGNGNPSTDIFRNAYEVTKKVKSGKKFHHIRAKYPI